MKAKLMAGVVGVVLAAAGLNALPPPAVAGTCDGEGPILIFQPAVNEDGPISGPVHSANDGPVTDPGMRPVHSLNCTVVAGPQGVEAQLSPAQRQWLLDREAELNLFLDQVRVYAGCVFFSVIDNTNPLSCTVPTPPPVPPPPPV